MKRTGVLLPLLVLAVLGAVAPVTSVSAVAMSGHASGFVWSADRVSWIGLYRLADGSPGFCLDVSRPNPLRSTFHYEDGASLGRWSADDRARLSYLATNWASTTDDVVAAAAQLAVWRITGLGGHDAAWFARRANEWAPTVLALSDIMLDRTERSASRGAVASAVVHDRRCRHPSSLHEKPRRI